MANKKESIYSNWEEINEAMRKLGELNVKIQKLEGEQTIKINEVKASILEKAEGLKQKITEIEKNIERYAQANKSEFLKTRHKKLSFGVVSFRLVKNISYSNVADAIKALKNLNLDFCLCIKEELNKDKLKEVDEATLHKAGIKINTVDKVKIEPNYVKLAAIVELND